MGILGDVKNFLGKSIDKVKTVFTKQDSGVEKKDTLNDKINKAAEFEEPNNFLNNSPLLKNFSNDSTQTSLIPGIETNPMSYDKSNWNRLTPRDNTFMESFSDATINAVDTLTALPGKIGGWYKNRIDTGKKEADAGKEYEENKEKVIISWAPKTYQYIGHKDDDMFQSVLSHRIGEMNNATTYDEYLAAREGLYNDGKKFLIPKDGVRGGVAQGEKIKNADESLFSGLPNRVRSNFEPTEDQFFAYLESIDENNKIKNDIYKNHGLTNDEEETVPENEWVQEFQDRAEKGLLDKINSKISGTKREMAVQRFRDSTNDQLYRIYNFVEPVFELEKEILKIPEHQRTEAERDMIDAAINSRYFLKQLSANLNNLYGRLLDEGVENGELNKNIDVFSDGVKLNEILTAGIGHMYGKESVFEHYLTQGHRSPIDIIEKYTNDKLYDYKMATEKNKIYRGWSRLEHSLAPLGREANEIGQFATTFFNFTPVLIANLIKKGQWGATYNTYLDNDFSIGMSLRTDESLGMRNLKKYGYQFLEYAPEGIANVAPEFAAIIATQGGATPLVLRRLGEVSRGIKAAKRLEEVRKIYKRLDKTLTGLEKILETGESWANLNSRNKRFWNIVDRGLTQAAIGQVMDAKLSVFDTEPYSDTSFWLSMLGTAGFDLLPEFKDLYGIFRNGLKGGKGRLNSGVWDVVDFISKSDENAKAVASALGKSKADFTEQDLRAFVETYRDVSDASKQAYLTLTKEGKEKANSFTKDLMYNYIRQAYGANSNIGKQVREIVFNKATTPADIIKYVAGIPGIVNFGPFSSTITLKQGTNVGVTAVAKDGWYDVSLDKISGGFGDKVSKGFTDSDILEISQLDGYKDIARKRQTIFDKVGDKYFLNEKGMKEFGLEMKYAPEETLGVTLSQAENTREILKERMKDLPGKKIEESTINLLADGGGYDEIVSKVKEILC